MGADQVREMAGRASQVCAVHDIVSCTQGEGVRLGERVGRHLNGPQIIDLAGLLAVNDMDRGDYQLCG